MSNLRARLRSLWKSLTGSPVFQFLEQVDFIWSAWGRIPEIAKFIINGALWSVGVPVLRALLAMLLKQNPLDSVVVLLAVIAIGWFATEALIYRRRLRTIFVKELSGTVHTSGTLTAVKIPLPEPGRLARSVAVGGVPATAGREGTAQANEATIIPAVMVEHRYLADTRSLIVRLSARVLQATNARGFRVRIGEHILGEVSDSGITGCIEDAVESSFRIPDWLESGNVEVAIEVQSGSGWSTVTKFIVRI